MSCCFSLFWSVGTVQCSINSAVDWPQAIVQIFHWFISSLMPLSKFRHQGFVLSIFVVGIVSDYFDSQLRAVAATSIVLQLARHGGEIPALAPLHYYICPGENSSLLPPAAIVI